MATAWLGLAAVPLLGSLITEPAAMTIAALMLAPQIFRADVPEGHKYLALGVLFVNVASGRRTWAEHWKLQNALVLFNPAPVT
jgi:Ca2+-dependent lipid-binding protein